MLSYLISQKFIPFQILQLSGLKMVTVDEQVNHVLQLARLKSVTAVKRRVTVH